MIRTIRVLFVLGFIVCQQVSADQISPNPNPSDGQVSVNTGDTDFNAENPYVNHGLIDISPGGTLINNAGAQINSSGGNALLVLHGSLNNEGTIDNFAVIDLEDQGVLNNGGVLNNSNLIGIRKGGALVNTDLLDNKLGADIQNFGTIVNDGTFTNDGSLSGSGTVVGSVTDSGIVAPGDAAAVHTIDGDWSKTGGSLEIEIGGTSDGGGDKTLTEFDWVDVTGDVMLAGQLNVSILDGFALGDFQQFPIINVAGALTGQFDGLGEGDRVGNFGRALFITYAGGDGNNVALFTTNEIPEPSTLILAGALVLCAGNWLRLLRNN